MKIHHLRNATLIIETQDKHIMVDPMLSEKAKAAPPFSFIRFKPRRNPIIDLPVSALEMATKTSHCLITHLHPDHLDRAGEELLRAKEIPVISSVKDKDKLEQRGLNVTQSVDYWKTSEFLGGTIQGIPALHGYGAVAKRMGNVMGYFIKLPNEPSVYLSSDTIYTEDVHKVLTELKPDIAVVACGSAQLDFYKPILMHMDDILRFIKTASGQVVANHLEALNHCPTRRVRLRKEVEKLGLTDKIWIPDDGNSKEFK